jgi:hypothetical protein
MRNPQLHSDFFAQLAATNPFQRRAARRFERGQVTAVHGNQADVRVAYDENNNPLELKDVPAVSGYVPRVGDWVSLAYEGGQANAPWIVGPSMPEDSGSDSSGGGVFPRAASAPAEPVESSVYYDDTDKTWRGWDGSGWVDIGGLPTPWTKSGSVIRPVVLSDDVALGGADSEAPFFFDVDANAAFRKWLAIVFTPTSALPALKLRPAVAPADSGYALLRLEDQNQAEVARWAASGDIVLGDPAAFRWSTNGSISRAGANLLSANNQLCFQGDTTAKLYKQAVGTMGLTGHFYLADAKQLRWATAGAYVVSDGTYMDLAAPALFRFYPRAQATRYLLLDLATWSNNRLYLQTVGTGNELYANLHFLPYSNLAYALGTTNCYWAYLCSQVWYANDTAYMTGATATRIAAVIGAVDILHLDQNLVDCQKRFKLGIDQTKASAGELDYRSATGRVELYNDGVRQIMHVPFRDYTEAGCASPVETTLKTYTIPANSLGTTLGLRFVMSGRLVGGGGGGDNAAFTLRLYFGGVLLHTWVMGSTSSGEFTDTWVAHWNLHNANASNAQKSDLFGVAVNSSGLNVGNLPEKLYAESNVDTTAAKNVVITAQLSNIVGSAGLSLRKVICEAN